jgi:hypothetical protein
MNYVYHAIQNFSREKKSERSILLPVKSTVCIPLGGKVTKTKGKGHV